MTVRSREECVVLIASPSVVVRRRIRRALEGLFSLHQATNRNEMERKVATLRPSILLFDLTLSRFNGARSLAAIHRLSSSTKIVVLSDSPDYQEEISALEAGAKGYCRNDLDHVLIEKAVRMVQKGEIWVERAIVPYLVKELANLRRPQNPYFSADPSRLNTLTARQHDIAFLISKGDTNREIAEALNISEATVKAHIHAIFRRLGVSDRLRIALYIREHSQGL
jgi:DNA-binding NarL/FixJ family response regulator